MKTTGNLNMKNAKLIRTLIAAAALLSPSLSSATTLSADAGGYTATDQTAYSFVDISGAAGGTSVLAGIDDSAVALTLPFSFSFYGTAYTQLCVSSNGAIYFVTDAATCATTTGDFAHLDLSAGAPAPDLPAIYPLWSDLTFQDAGAGSVFYQTLGTPGNRRFIVQWNTALPEGDASGVTFEVILAEGTNSITIQYKTVALGAGDNNRNGLTATVGIHNTGGFASSQQQAWSYNSAVLTDGEALLFQAGALPGAPTLTAPVDVSTNVSSPAVLTWNVAAGATSYDVYFGTAATPPIATASITALTYTTGSLTAGTTYYWKVVAKNGSGSTPSAIFSFSTPAPAGGGGGGGGGGGVTVNSNPPTLSASTVTISANFGTTVSSQSITMTYKTFTEGPVYSTSVGVDQGKGWLSVSPASGALTQTALVNGLYTYTATIAIKGDPTGIAVGSSYTGTVYLTTPGGTTLLPVTMNVAAALPPPVLPQPTGGIANSASASQAVASVVTPGSYVSIYGAGLAGTGDPNAPALVFPLPTTLNGAQVTVCGVPAPLLYAGATQINLLIPQNLSSATSCPLVVTFGTVASAPIQLVVTPLQPGIYTPNFTGSGQGIITNALTAVLNSASAPAHAGDFLVIYATGLGPVTGENGAAGPADGASTPATTVFHTNATVTAAIGGVPTPVLFSGLTPTLVGLYQVNVQLPAGVTPGSAVPVVMTVTDPKTGATAQSNTVTIIVQ